MTTRKEFIAGTTLLASTSASTATLSAPPSGKDPFRFTFDRGRFETILNKPALHRQCFGSANLRDATVLEAMNNSMRAYEEYLDEQPGALHAIAVLYRGPSIFMAMSDDTWNGVLSPFVKGAQAKGGAENQFTGVQTGKGNPFLRATSNDPDDVSVQRAAQHGASFFVCHNAIVGFSRVIASAAGKPAAHVYQQLMRGVVPEALVVPAGVMAINACQEARFTYIAS